MRTLVFITSQFPFGTGESFIESEFPILEKNFGKIIIIAQNTFQQKTRNISDNSVIYRYNPATSFPGFIYLPLLVLINSGIISRLFKEELIFRKGKNETISVRNIFDLVKRIIKAVQLRDFIKNKLKKEGVSGHVVFYSYWLRTGAHAIALIKCRNCIRISRAHGSDIYEEKTRSGYLPLLKFAGMNLDAIFFISGDGKEYFERKTKMKRGQFFISYLGVKKPDFEIISPGLTDKFVIVSCSNMVPLKRIEMIIYALENVRANKYIEWLHFGNGILMNEIQALAGTRLLPLKRINFRLMGHYPNEELLKYYSQNHVNLFINTSSTEGVPVSIMEAQIFGIPVIVTDTGGVKEVVTEGTGSLLPIDFKPGFLARQIEYYINLTAEETETIRNAAKKNQELKFDATSNYNDFIMKVNSILADSD